jgi:polysaccharide lyase-like protein
MTSPNDPGQLYTLDWEQFECRSQQTPQGWNPDLASTLAHPNGEPAYRVACPPDPVRSGRRSARFQLNRGDGEVAGSGSKRAELKAPCCEPVDQERWYGFSIYLAHWETDASAEILAQWHQAESADARFGGSPPLALSTRGSSWGITMRKPSWDDQVDKDTARTDVGSWASDVWTSWVFHVLWRPDSSGVLQVWKDTDPDPVFRLDGAQNKFDDGRGNYMKFGIYKWDWATKDTDTDQRVVYVDDLRIADRTGSREKVSPPRPRGCLSLLTSPFFG